MSLFPSPARARALPLVRTRTHSCIPGSSPLNTLPAYQMIVEPELRIPDFAKAGADIISVHAEVASTIHLHRSVNMVRLLQRWLVFYGR